MAIISYWVIASWNLSSLIEACLRFVFFKGRSIVFKEQGQILLLRLAQDLEDIGKVEQMPELDGKRMIMFIIPKKN